MSPISGNLSVFIPSVHLCVHVCLSQGAWAVADRQRARREDGRIKPWCSRWRRPTPACRSLSQRSTPPCTPFIKTGCRARTPHRPAHCCIPSTRVRLRPTHSPHTCSGEREGQQILVLRLDRGGNKSSLRLAPDSARTTFHRSCWHYEGQVEDHDALQTTEWQLKCQWVQFFHLATRGWHL